MVTAARRRREAVTGAGGLWRGGRRPGPRYCHRGPKRRGVRQVRTTGFRLILDDSQKRLVLGLGRDPLTHARRVVVIGATGVAPIPFAWDNFSSHAYDVYEVGRLASGAFTGTVTNGDPNSSDPPVTVTVPAAALPPSAGPAMFAWGMGAAGGGVSLWQEVHARVEPGVLPVAIDVKPGSAENTINLRSAGAVLVAILSSPTFDALTVDPATVALAGASVKPWGRPAATSAARTTSTGTAGPIWSATC